MAETRLLFVEEEVEMPEVLVVLLIVVLKLVDEPLVCCLDDAAANVVGAVVMWLASISVLKIDSRPVMR